MPLVDVLTAKIRLGENGNLDSKIKCHKKELNLDTFSNIQEKLARLFWNRPEPVLAVRGQIKMFLLELILIYCETYKLRME
jgi:hypothetical protein